MGTLLRRFKALRNKTRVLSALAFTSFILVVGTQSALAADDYKSATAAGLAAMDSEKYDDAEKNFKKAMEVSQFKGPKYGDYSTALINLGNLAAKRKQTSQAENYYREALNHYQKAFGEKSLECANVNQCMGDMYRRAGKYESAIAYYKTAQAVREAAAKDHPDLAETLAGLAECKAKIGKKEDAIVLMQKVVSIREKAFGKFSMKVLKSRFNLAQLYDDVGKRPLAIAAYENIIADAGTSEQRSAGALERLAVLYSQEKKNGKADTTFKQALALREAKPGKNNADLNNCLKLYAEFMRKQSREDDAKKLEARIPGGAKKATN